MTNYILILKNALWSNSVRPKKYKNLLCGSVFSVMICPQDVNAMQGMEVMSAEACSKQCEQDRCATDDAYTCLNLCRAHQDNDKSGQIKQCIATQEFIMQSKLLSNQDANREDSGFYEDDDEAELARALVESSKEYDQEQSDLALAIEKSKQEANDRQKALSSSQGIEQVRAQNLDRDKRMQDELFSLEDQQLSQEIERVRAQNLDRDKRMQDELFSLEDQQLNERKLGDKKIQPKTREVIKDNDWDQDEPRQNDSFWQEQLDGRRSDLEKEFSMTKETGWDEVEVPKDDSFWQEQMLILQSRDQAEPGQNDSSNQQEAQSNARQSNQNRPLPPLPVKKGVPANLAAVVGLDNGNAGEKEQLVDEFSPPPPPSVPSAPSLAASPNVDDFNYIKDRITKRRLSNVESSTTDLSVSEDDISGSIASDFAIREKEIKMGLERSISDLNKAKESYAIIKQNNPTTFHRDRPLADLKAKYQSVGQSIVELRNLYNGRIQLLEGHHKNESFAQEPDLDYLEEMVRQQQGFRNQIAMLNKQLDGIKKDAESQGIIGIKIN